MSIYSENCRFLFTGFYCTDGILTNVKFGAGFGFEAHMTLLGLFITFTAGVLLDHQRETVLNGSSQSSEFHQG